MSGTSIGIDSARAARCAAPAAFHVCTEPEVVTNPSVPLQEFNVNRFMSRPSFIDLAIAFALVSLAALSVLGLTTSAHAQTMSAEQRAVMQACRSDARKLCKGLKPGGGQVAACLNENKASLSPGCASQLDRLAGCAGEVRKLCPDASGAKELGQCAQEKRDELSSVCRSAARN